VDDASDPPDPDRREPPRPAESPLVLRRHHLSHLPPLKVSWSVLETRYPAGCSPGNCDASCCRLGVGVDVAHRDRILQHAELVQAVMGPEQERDPVRWFDDQETTDADFPSGRCVSTRVYDGRCVFLDRAGRCVLQTATTAAARPEIDLKPFFCFAFPITLLHGTLWVDELCLEGPAQCCRPAVDGTLSVLEVCETELRHVLGDEGLEELRLSAKEYLA
jgi:Fe-S-cluster containining protein